MTFHKLFFRLLAGLFLIGAFVVDIFYEVPHDLPLNIMGIVWITFAVFAAFTYWHIGGEEP
jgi:hypothetical protein